jgi:hypothetical protein
VTSFRRPENDLAPRKTRPSRAFKATKLPTRFREEPTFYRRPLEVGL